MSRIMATYLAWFGAALAIYWPALELLPQKDHAVFMLGRELYRNDWNWILDVLSYNRTRLLLPGDHISFRPLHMAIIAVEDLLFRHAFRAQGIIGCTLFAATASVMFAAVKRLSGVLVAIPLVLLWMCTAAGASIVLWQHIAPYSLGPGLLLGAVLLLHGEGGRRSPVAAGACVLGAVLLGELSVLVALGVSGYFLVAGPKSARRGSGAVFLVPTLLALAVNALDYFLLHPVPAVVAPDGRMATTDLLQGILAFVGSIGGALLTPWSVRFQNTWVDSFLFNWPFWDLGVLHLSLCALPVAGLVALSVRDAVRRSLEGEDGFEETLRVLFLALFAAVCAVCSLRMATRGGEYLGGATYYYSIGLLALLGMLVSWLSCRPGRMTTWAVVPLLLAAVVHVYVLRRELAEASAISRPVVGLVREARGWLKDNPSFCYAGDTALPGGWGVLFHDYSCTARPNAEPAYLLAKPGLRPAFCRIHVPPPPRERIVPLEDIREGNPMITERGAVVPFGHEIRFALDRVGEFDLILQDAMGETYRFRVERNLVRRTSIYTNWYQVTGWDAAGSRVEYRICYFSGSVVFVGNGLVLGGLPVPWTVGNLLRFSISASGGDLKGLREVRLSDVPAVKEVRVEPVREFQAVVTR